jgi:hypothetical protein
VCGEEIRGWQIVTRLNGKRARLTNRVETNMYFSVFAKMRKSSENVQIFAKFHKISFRENFSFSRKCGNENFPFNPTKKINVNVFTDMMAK